MERVLRGLITDLNTLDSEFGIIDTHLREHAWLVLLDVGATLDVPQAQLSTGSDEERHF